MKKKNRIHDELFNNLIILLLNAWIFSGMRDASLWKTLSSFARSWRNLDAYIL